MRRLISYTFAVTALATAVVTAQKVTTPEDLDKAMKKIAPAQAATNKAIQSMAWADAKAQVAIVKQTLTDTESFWTSHKKDDAVAMLKDSIAKVTAVEQVDAFVFALGSVEESCSLEPGALHFEIQVETPQAILAADGTALIARMIHAGGERLL